MRFFQSMIGALALVGAVLSAQAEPLNGVNYLTLPNQNPVPAGKKIEVIEFFAYYCPHCDVFEPVLAAWVKKQGNNIVFKRVHVPRDENVLPQQRLFFTLDQMGLVEKYHTKVFDAMHRNQRLRLNRDEMVFDLVERLGIDRKKFTDTYRSFEVQTRVAQANAMMDDYFIDKWPSIAIDGRYVTSPTAAVVGIQPSPEEAEMHRVTLATMDFLLAKAKAEKK